MPERLPGDAQRHLVHRAYMGRCDGRDVWMEIHQRDLPGGRVLVTQTVTGSNAGHLGVDGTILYAETLTAEEVNR